MPNCWKGEVRWAVGGRLSVLVLVLVGLVGVGRGGEDLLKKFQSVILGLGFRWVS